MATRKRTLRRANDRAVMKLAKDLERLFLLSPGGAPERAIAITSPAEVEVIARSMPCPVCQGELRIDEHAAEVHGATRVRVARVTCLICRRNRSIYFALPGATLS